MINRIVLVGRLVKDPEIKFGNSGTAITNFNMAVDRSFKKEGQPDADFPRVVQLGKGAEATANFMSKGSLVAVDGKLQTRSWDDDSGKRQYATEVLADTVKFLDSKSKSENGNTNNQQNNQQQNNQNQQKNEDPFTDNGEPIDISDDDLPF